MFFRRAVAVCPVADEMSVWGRPLVGLALAVVLGLILVQPCLAGGTYQVHEFTWTAGGVYENPYVETSLTCTFTGPPETGSLQLVTPGFWDGDDVWRCRVAPPLPGTWTYTTVSPDAGLDGRSGSFPVYASSQRGFLERRGDHDWQRSSGAQVFLMGDTCWRCLNTVRYSDADFTAYLEARAAQRFNLIRGYVMSQYRAADDDINQGGEAFLVRDVINPAYWQEVDRRIQEANAAGITWSMVLGGDGNQYQWYFISQEQSERYLTMLVARYAAYDVIWDGVAEGHEHDDYLNLVSTLGRFLETHDPYAHPRGQHPAEVPGNSLDWVGESWMEYVSYQGGVDNEQLVADRVHALPLVQEEYCFEFNCYIEESSAHDCSSQVTRHETWRVAMGGAYPVGGHVGSYTGGSRPFDSCSLGDEAMEDFVHLHDLFATLPLAEMTPANHLTDQDGFVYRWPNQVYVLYFDESYGQNFTVDLSEAVGRLRARWLNPRTGGWLTGYSVDGGGPASLMRPDLQDWVLVLDRDSTHTSSGGGAVSRGRITVDLPH